MMLTLVPPNPASHISLRAFWVTRLHASAIELRDVAEALLHTHPLDDDSLEALANAADAYLDRIKTALRERP